VQAQSRDLPVAVADAQGGLNVGCFGGRFNIAINGSFGSERRLPAPRRKPLGFVDLATSSQGAGVCAVWEEGDAINNDELAGDSDILFARLDPAE
jgi:hypothetical protein